MYAVWVSVNICHMYVYVCMCDYCYDTFLLNKAKSIVKVSHKYIILGL